MMKTAPKNEDALAVTSRRALQAQAELRRAIATTERRMRDDGEERFQRILRKLDKHTRILNRLVKLVEALPERILEAIGFRGESK